jgi:hypothetical protein
MGKHVIPIKKNQSFKMVCLRFDGELISMIDKQLKELGITRTQWIHQAAHEKLSKEK